MMATPTKSIITPSMAEEAIASAMRTIAIAKPDLRSVVFGQQAREVLRIARGSGVSHQDAIDRLYDQATSTGLVAELGPDAVTKLLGDAKSDTECLTAAPTTNGKHHHIASKPESTDRLVFDVVADVQASPISWVWPGRLARRKLTLIAGDPGLGKSQVTVDIVARISVGGLWPDGMTTAPRGSVLVLSAEDSISDTLRPRLEVAGAELSRVHVLRAVTSGDGARRSFSLQAHLDQLGDQVKRLGDVVVVIIDPITSYMGKIDSHRTTDVRAVLEPLSDFAEQHNVAVLAVTHPPKATQAKAMHAVTGSLAFVAAARMVFLAVEEPETGRRLLLPVKNNVGAMAAGLAFGIASANTKNGISTSRVVWSSDPVTITANQALSESAESGRTGGGRMREAIEFLADLLSAGPVLQKQVEAKAKDLDISDSTLKRARKTLHVKSAKDGFSGGWMWRLPQGREEGQEGQDGHEEGQNPKC